MPLSAANGGVARNGFARYCHRGLVVGAIMSEEAREREPVPAVIWWLLATVAFCFIFMWASINLSRALWWLGLLVGSVAIAVITLWIRDALDYENGFHTLADLTTRLFWTIAALLFLFGAFVVGTSILGPIFSSLTGPGGYSGRYSDPFD